MKSADIFKEKQYDPDNWIKKTLYSADQIVVDTYYFQKGQVLKFHKHPNSDQVFFFFEGEAKFLLDDEKKKEELKCGHGTTVLAPAGVWHEVQNTGSGNLIVAQATKAPVETVWRT